MADALVRTILARKSHTPQRETGDGVREALWADRAGALVVVSTRDALVREGRVWGVDIGAFSTPITGGGAGTILDIDQPEGIISVPDGVTIKPLRVAVQCLTPLLAADADESEILVAVDRASAWAVDGTRTDEIPFNMRTNTPSGSRCPAASAFTADTTDPVLGIELAREIAVGDVQGVAANALWGNLSLLYEPDDAPYIVGPAMLVVYWGGTVATPGFAQIRWAEYLTPEIV